MLDLFDFVSFWPTSYNFNRSLKDMRPTEIIEKDGKVIIVANALGISEKNIDIKVEQSKWNGWKYALWVRGNTHNEVLDKDFTINIPFALNKDVKNIEWSLENGVLTLEVSFEEPVVPSVKISKK